MSSGDYLHGSPWMGSQWGMLAAALTGLDVPACRWDKYVESLNRSQKVWLFFFISLIMKFYFYWYLHLHSLQQCLCRSATSFSLYFCTDSVWLLSAWTQLPWRVMKDESNSAIYPTLPDFDHSELYQDYNMHLQIFCFTNYIHDDAFTYEHGKPG